MTNSPTLNTSTSHTPMTNNLSTMLAKIETIMASQQADKCLEISKIAIPILSHYLGKFYLVQADALKEKQEMGSAHTSISQLFQIPELDKNLKIQAFFKRAHLYAEEKRFDEAFQTLKALYPLVTGTDIIGQFYCLEASLYYSNNKIDQAITAAETGLKIPQIKSEHRANLFLEKAKGHYAKREYEEALEALADNVFSTVQMTDPKCVARSSFLRGLILKNQEKYAEALSAFFHAIKLDVLENYIMNYAEVKNILLSKEANTQNITEQNNVQQNTSKLGKRGSSKMELRGQPPLKKSNTEPQITPKKT